MDSLDAIAVRHQSDKSLMLPGRNGHGYAQHYDRFFGELRGLPVRLLEIGVDQGASLRMWEEAFPLAQIIGVDNNPKCLAAKVGRSKIVLGDQASPEFWNDFISCHGSGWNIIVDDGGHYANQIITSLRCLWPHVSHRGFYCVEDLGTAYPHYTQGRIQCHEVYLANCIPPGWENHMDFLKRKIDEINLGSEIEFAFFAKELVILQKS